MSNIELDIIKGLLHHRKYSAITDYSRITHPEKGNIIVTEYVGSGVRLYKDLKGNTRVLCPQNIDIIQEGHVANAIANGTIFDDADEIDNNASMIERTSLPYDAMINSGKNTPKHVKPMIAIVIGKMHDDGSFDVSDTDRTNGINFIKDLCDKDKCPRTADVVDNYLDKDKETFYTPEMGRDVAKLDKEVDDICDTNPEDCISDDDCCDSYDDYDMDELESDSIENDTDESNDDEKEDKNENDNSDEEEDDVSESVDLSAYIHECGEPEIEEEAYAGTGAKPVTSIKNNTTGLPENTDDKINDIVEEDANIGTEKTMPNGSVNTAPKPMSAQVKTILADKASNPNVQQEGFLTKKPKKLKPIPRDIVAYITVEMNDIHDANDQAMLSGYTCSKIELVDFYLTVLDTDDPRYIVPHNRQYLQTMQRDLENLLAQILRIRPINRSEQIWRVNYPTK